MFSLFFFRSGHGDAVKFLIEYGCSPNLQDHQQSTPLHLAAEKGHIQVVEVLLSYPDTNLVSYHDYQVMFFISYLLFSYLDTNLVSYHDNQVMFVISYLLFRYLDTNLYDTMNTRSCF